MIDRDLCQAIGTVLQESSDRALTPRMLSTFVRPYVRVPATVSDVQAVLVHLETRGDVRRIADPDDPEILSYVLTPAGKVRFPG
jgi:hypothetical protein